MMLNFSRKITSFKALQYANKVVHIAGFKQGTPLEDLKSIFKNDIEAGLIEKMRAKIVGPGLARDFLYLNVPEENADKVIEKYQGKEIGIKRLRAGIAITAENPQEIDVHAITKDSFN